MPTKSTGRKNGVQRGIKRNRAAIKQRDEALEVKNLETGRVGWFSWLDRLTSISSGQKCFNRMFVGCEKLRLIGFTRTQNGDFVLLQGRARVWHSAALLWYLVVCMQKIWSTYQVFQYEELGLRFFLCLSLTAMQVHGVVLGTGVVLRPRESIDLLNSWSYDLPGTSLKFHPLDNFSTRLKVLSYSYVCIGPVFIVALMSLTDIKLPVFLVPVLADRFYLPPQSILLRFAWKLLFAPIEFLMFLPPILLASFCTALLFMGTSSLEIYLEPVRRKKVRSITSRERLEQAYVQVELFSRIFQNCVRFFFPPWLFMTACGVTITIFVTIRHTDMPLLLYVNYPLTGLTFMLVLLWQSHGMVRVCRASEDTLGILWQHQAPYFKEMTRSSRIEVMNRAKAMRPLVFPLADSEFSLNVPINTWEEILNQLLFLLSL